MKKLFIFLYVFILFIGISRIFTYFKKSKISPYKEYVNLIPNTYRLGFTNLDKEVRIDKLEVTGSIPSWLAGTLIRNGPGKFSAKKSWVSNWFDGLTMLHAFTINNGNVKYINKFLKSKDYEHTLKTGKMDYAGFVQDPCSSTFKHLFTQFFTHPKNEINNANVNVAKFTNKFIALTETPLPVEFDLQTLNTLGVMNYNDEYPKTNIHDTAHPHYDSIAKEHLGYFTKFGSTSSHNLFRIKHGTTKREIIALYQTNEPSYMHSFGLTKNYAILTGLPLIASPLSLKFLNKGFIQNFSWKPELGTKFIVFDRVKNLLIGTFKAESFFAFHVVNAFEENRNIIIDIVTYNDPSIIYKDSLLENLLKQKENQIISRPILKRFTIDLDNHKVTSKVLSNESIELPRINYENYNTKDYNYVYGYAGFDHPLTANKLVKINVKTGEIKQWSQEKCYTGEPVFIQKPGSTTEDDGVVLSVILNAQTATSFLLILDAKDFTELARAQVPHHIPFGVHGQYFAE